MSNSVREVIPMIETNLLHGDCLIESDNIESGSVDLILTDLPYGNMNGAGLDGWGGNMKHIVSFSGGKDSTAMLLKMIENNMTIDEVIMCDTGVEFEDMYNHIEKVQSMINIPITILKSDKSYHTAGGALDVYGLTRR